MINMNCFFVCLCMLIRLFQMKILLIWIFIRSFQRMTKEKSLVLMGFLFYFE